MGLGILGLYIGGPIGGFIGYLIGGQIDKKSVGKKDMHDIFYFSLIALLAAATKADNKIDPREKKLVYDFINSSFPSQAGEMITIYDKALTENYNTQQLINGVAKYLDKTSKLALIDLLFKISYADNELAAEENRLINQCAAAFGISSYELDSLRIQNMPKNTHYKNEKRSGSQTAEALAKDDAYKILELDTSATHDEIKAAYRDKIKKYHPDKFAYLGDDFKQIAEEKTRLLNAAYKILIK